MSPFYSLALEALGAGAHCYNRAHGALSWRQPLLLSRSLSPPIPPRNDFRFSILGDRTGDAQPGVYEQVWRELDALHPDFVINVGDTIQGGNDATAASEWRALRPLWDRYRYPIYFTPGNHDIWSPASRAVYEQQTGHPAFYSFNYQNAHFTVLDNSQASDFSTDLRRFDRCNFWPGTWRKTAIAIPSSSSSTSPSG